MPIFLKRRNRETDNKKIRIFWPKNSPLKKVFQKEGLKIMEVNNEGIKNGPLIKEVMEPPPNKRINPLNNGKRSP